MSTSPARARRPATDAEAKALASGLRLRILRMVLDDPLTNKEIAERLGRHPASVLHHVRTLVDTGFLQALPVRRGVRGSREVPYRATRKSWDVDDGDRPDTDLAMVDAFVAESRASGLDGALLVRLGLRLTDAEREELAERLMAVVHDVAGRAPTAGGTPWSLFLAVHRDSNRD